MTAIHGTVRDGRIVLDQSPDWPNGSRVRVEIEREATLGPEAVERWICSKSGR
jgi:hypothetical protein